MVAGILGLGITAVSVCIYFSPSYRTIFSYKEYYNWNDQADWALKTSRLITVDADCAKPIVDAEYQKWNTARLANGRLEDPVPLDMPEFRPSDRMIIAAEPSGGWSDLGLYNLSEKAMIKVQSTCLRYTIIYAHLGELEINSDISRWARRGEPPPMIGFGLAVIGMLGITGVFEAFFEWIMRGQFRPPP